MNAFSGAETWPPYAAAVPLLCQYCGAELPEGARACMQCVRGTVSAFVRPTLGEDEDAIEYECDDLDPATRARVSDALAAAAVPFTWEPGLVLAVADGDETKADDIFDAVEDEEQDLDEGAAQVADEDILPAAPDAWGAGEDAFTSLGDLYDAADRLFHFPADVRAGLDLRAAATAVEGAAPPYGFNAVLWRTAGELAAQLIGLIDAGASNEDIQAGAEALRDVLAEHV